MTYLLNLFQKQKESKGKLGEPRITGVPPGKLDSCVDKVSKKGNVDNPWAVCVAQMKKSYQKEKQDKSKGGNIKPGKNLGKTIKYWFWDADFGKKINLTENDNSKSIDKKSLPMDAEEEVRQILVDNPQISGASLLNTLKSKGIQLIKVPLQQPAKQNPTVSSEEEECEDEAEADASSSQPSAFFSPGAINPLKLKKKSKSKESKEINTKGLVFYESTRFKESSSKDNGIGPTKFEVVLLKEGLGNLQDAYYYTKQALESAVQTFTGKKMYVDHPSLDDEKNRPERSVKDISGYFDGLRIVEQKDGQNWLVGDLSLMPDKQYEWVRGLIREAVKYNEKFPDKDLVGLSINASGEAEEKSIEDFLKESEVPDSVKPKLQKAIENGIKTIRVVSAIEDATSCDLVTEPGAGGKILQMIEGKESTMSDDQKKKELEDKKKLEEAKKKVTESEDDKDGGDEHPASKDGDGDDHDDAQQDIELIRKQLAKFIQSENEEDDDGDDDHDDDDMKKKMMKKKQDQSENEEEESENEEGAPGETPVKDLMIGKEMYQAYKEMGYGEDEAMEAAAHSMKLAKHMGMKQAEAENEEDESENEEKKKEAKKESNNLRNENLKIKAELAKLKEDKRKRDLQIHIESICAKSGLSREVTKQFRESLGTVRSKEEVDKAWSLFKKAYELAGGESEWVLSTEKMTESEGGKKSISFEDCVN